MAADSAWKKKYSDRPVREAQSEIRKAIYKVWRNTGRTLRPETLLSDDTLHGAFTLSSTPTSPTPYHDPPTHSQRNSVSMPPPSLLPTQPRPTESDDDVEAATNPEWLSSADPIPKPISFSRMAKATSSNSDSSSDEQSKCNLDGDVDCDEKCSALELIDGVWTAYDVPLHSEHYHTCADFATDADFPMTDFGEKVVSFACLSDLLVRKPLRQRRNVGRKFGNGVRVRKEADEDRGRKIWVDDAAQFKFLKGAAGNTGRYMELFVECFTRNDQWWMDIHLEDYMDAKVLERREGRPPIVFGRNFGIDMRKRDRLYLLLNVWQRYLVVGVSKLEKEKWLPWQEPFDIIMEQINDVEAEVLNLCDVDDDADDHDTDGDVLIKEEMGSD